MLQLLWHQPPYLPPAQVPRLTECELALALDADVERIRPPTGSTPAPSYREILADQARRRRMTHEQHAAARWQRLCELKRKIDAV